MCPELCYGLFVKTGATPSRVEGPIPIIDANQVSGPETLVAHTISTKSRSKVVTDDDMKVPANWQADPKAAYDVGNQRDGRSVALHALAVDPQYQRVGFGKALMKAYIDQIGKTGVADRISILTYDRLVEYYKKLGFTHYGKSESNYAGVEWHDLVRHLSVSRLSSFQSHVLTFCRHMSTLHEEDDERRGERL